MISKSWLKILNFIIFLLVIYLLMDFKHEPQDEVYLNEKLEKAMNEFKMLYMESEKLRLQYTPNSNGNSLKGPREEYELVRRRISTNTKEIWYYISSELQSLSGEVTNVNHVYQMKMMADEHYRSLMSDETKLSDVDGHSEWRRRENRYLSRLVEKRLALSQNPPDCGKAKKLLCKFPNYYYCGYGCRLHNFVKCLIIAYGTERTLVVDDSTNRKLINGGWETLFLPLSSCASARIDEPITQWPGDQDVQVVSLTLPIQSAQRPRFIPVVLPEDLASRLNVLHGDPAVWWIGQFFKYLLRPQPLTSKVFDAYADRVGFQKPIVGMHIRRSDKIIREAASHRLEEYMHHVEEYYRIKQLNGSEVYKRRIYLATDEPTLFDEAKQKYPQYEVIGDPSLSQSGSVNTREMDYAILNINIDIHFLSLCDYIVCTFSSNVCRLAYELMNSFQPDASAQFKSLDDSFYFDGQIHRLDVAVIPHKSNNALVMDLQIGDEIEIGGNHWNGYSKGTNLRTKQTLLYPTFKVTPKFEVEPFASYPNITVNPDDLEDRNR